MRGERGDKRRDSGSARAASASLRGCEPEARGGDSMRSARGAATSTPRNCARSAFTGGLARGIPQDPRRHAAAMQGSPGFAAMHTAPARAEPTSPVTSFRSGLRTGLRTAFRSGGCCLGGARERERDAWRRRCSGGGCSGPGGVDPGRELAAARRHHHGRQRSVGPAEGPAARGRPRARGRRGAACRPGRARARHRGADALRVLEPELGPPAAGGLPPHAAAQPLPAGGARGDPRQRHPPDHRRRHRAPAGLRARSRCAS